MSENDTINNAFTLIIDNLFMWYILQLFTIFYECVIIVEENMNFLLSLLYTYAKYNRNKFFEFSRGSLAI